MVSINRPSVYLVLLNCLIGFRSYSTVLQDLGLTQLSYRIQVFLHPFTKSIYLSFYISISSICPSVVCPFICHYVVSFICQSVSMSYILSQSYLYLRLSVCVCQYICFCHIFYISLICQSRPSVYISVIYIQSRFYDIPPFL